MTIVDFRSSSYCLDVYPVFHGLEQSRITGKEIADMVGVTPPTVSKWRRGRAKVPPVKLVLLTMLLANWLDELESLRKSGVVPSAAWQQRLDVHIDLGRRCLRMQETFNEALPKSAVREGMRLFQEWWQSAGRSMGPAGRPPGARPRLVT